jgi:pimeloyl-ACP methyl ester carboxylesterase
MANKRSKTIVFITGSFVHHSCWDEWKTYFESKGYTTHNPPWPHKNASVAELRARHPHKDKGLALLSLEELVRHYANFILALPEKPIIIGHSFGGLLTQLMINKELGVAGVSIHPAPPFGVFPYEFSFLKAGWKALGILTDQEETYLMSFEDWQYAFTNGMPLEEQQAGYDKLVIPESKTVTRDALTTVAKIDFSAPHVPLLIVAGDTDHIIPAHLNKRNFDAYEQNGSITEYKLYRNRNHYVLALPTWKEDADDIIEWLDKVGA